MPADGRLAFLLVARVARVAWLAFLRPSSRRLLLQVALLQVGLLDLPPLRFELVLASQLSRR